MWRTERHRLLPVLVASLGAALPTIATAAAPPADDRHLGVATCASTTCHGQAKAARGSNIQQNEYLIWSRYDPHAGAFALLFEERSRLMAERLGLKAAHEAPECLACHAEDVPAALRGPKFQVSDGIGCEACHGGAGRWLASHYSPQATRASNVADGLAALDDPAVRAATCTGCHVGDATSRFATHRIMAAGHPRLPFELDTWTGLWCTAGGREHYVVDADYLERKPPPASIDVWTTGLVRQGRQLAGILQARYRTDRGLPDFSLFNCYSCHREMRLADWRDRGRDAGGAPGQLRFDDSSLTLLSTALAARPELQRDLQAATLGLQRTAGLDAASVARAAAALESQLASIETALARSPLRRDEAQRALAALARSAARGDYPDYASAEQAAMGLSILAATVGNCGPDSAAVRGVFASVASDTGWRPDRLAQATRTAAALCGSGPGKPVTDR
ncbi:MAG: hypothetical protein JNM50_10240 [Chromatiales bacterium]|jgi:hypothetical protein|nr:hypothetical protein [Chromatiales bacterium]